MSIDECFDVAKRADFVSNIIFGLVVLASTVLLLSPLGTKLNLKGFIEPFLIVAAIVGIVSNVVTVSYQTEGNRLRRESQISDGLGATIGDSTRDDYYNSPLPHSVERLASTTLENTLFTSEILRRMIVRKRVLIASYLAIFLLLLSFRGTSLSWMLLLTQSLFSGNVVLVWARMERYRCRTHDVHECLKQFFLQGGNSQSPNGMAIILAAFTNYECAKDEAAMPLNDSIFMKLNPSISKEWETLKRKLKIEE
jgi:hypothetical protein